MDKLDTMKLFVAVAQEQSFVAASRKLNISAPAATRAVAQLEHKLGIKLFNRTTRTVRLTDSGTRYFADCKRIIEDVEQAEAVASGSYVTPKGSLSVTAPVLFGQKHITPILTEYLQQHPEVEVKSLFYDRVSNILDEGIDVAVRVGHLKDSSMYATQVGSIRRVICASPDYLSKEGTPTEPEDLLNHNIIYASGAESSTNWRFEREARSSLVKVQPRLYCNQNGTAIEAAKQGLGITRLMSYQVGDEFDKGSLVRILTDYEPSPLPVNIIHLEGRQANAKVRTFIDLAVERLRANPYIH